MAESENPGGYKQSLDTKLQFGSHVSPNEPQHVASSNEPPDLIPAHNDIASGALAGTPAQPAAPAKPSVASRVANFISNGQATPGSVWRGILSGALTGMTAGAGQGHFGGGVSAGAQAQSQAAQQRLQNQMAQTREQQEGKLRQAQIAELNHRIVSDSWDLSNRQAIAMENHGKLENALRTEALAAPGSVDLGIVRNPDDLATLHQQYPDLPRDISRANIVSMPHFEPVVGADGKPTGEMKYDGISAFYVPTDWKNKKIDHDVSVPKFEAPKKPGEAGTWGTMTFKAGTITNEEATKATMDQAAQVAKYDNDAAIAKANAALARAQIAAKGKPGDLTEEEINTLGGMMAKDPAHLDLKSLVSLKGNARTKVFLAAKRADSKFNPQKATLALKTFEDFTTGKVADNLSAFNGAVRHLSLLGDAALALHNNDTVALNKMMNELQLQVGGGGPQAMYNAIHAAVEGEVGKVYKGSSPTDQEIGIMKQAFNDAQSPEAAAAAVNTTMRLMGEKVQDYYRRFRNGTGQTPEENGMQLVDDDVQQAFKSHGMTGINPNAPPAPNKQKVIPAGNFPVTVNGEVVGFAPSRDSKTYTPFN